MAVMRRIATLTDELYTDSSEMSMKSAIIPHRYLSPLKNLFIVTSAMYYRFLTAILNWRPRSS